MRRRRTFLASVGAVLGLLLASGATAQSSPGPDSDRRPWFHDTLNLDAAAVFAFIDSDVDFPPKVDLEDDLGLDDFTVEPDVKLAWRFTESKKHQFELSYFSILRSAKQTLNFDLELPGGGTIPIDARADTKLDVYLLSLVYGWSLLHDEKKEAGIFLGLDLIGAEAKLEGQLLGVTLEDKLDDNVSFPFPTAGAFFNWAFLERWALFTRFQYFGVQFDDIGGQLFEGNLRIQHDTFEHANFYVGYDVLGGDVDAGASFGKVSFLSQGPTVGAVFRF